MIINKISSEDRSSFRKTSCKATINQIDMQELLYFLYQIKNSESSGVYHYEGRLFENCTEHPKSLKFIFGKIIITIVIDSFI